MSTINVGKIQLRSLTDLLIDTNDEESVISKTSTVAKKTPENKKLARTRAATTTRKRKNAKTETDQQIIISSTVVKRTGKKEPLPGQLRIDSFFKSGTKSYKVETIEKSAHNKTKTRRTPRKGRKRLFEEASETTTTTTTTSEFDEKITKPTRSRIQPMRNAKVKCSPVVDDVIDLCSDDEAEIKREIPLVESDSPVLGILTPSQPESISVETTPRHNLRTKAPTETPSKENVPKQRKRKICPAYKVVQDTTFVVDGFQFGDIPNATHYFLSHYHADHYIGLTRKFAHPLYMSPITASLVRTFIPIDEQYLHEIDVDETITVNDIEITAIDANQ